ncbi:MAG: DUF192 domain-containing protein [Deltaproteobacteria bacterium]|nr:DUF192 domain-containing protein [Deltaproteobacteria bacterium]
MWVKQLLKMSGNNYPLILKRAISIELFLILLISCSIRDFKTENKPADEINNISHFVQFYRGDKLIVTFKVELAITEEERQKGLMFRENLPEDSGMLFLFKDESIHNFWMKNTYIPLDLIFIASDMSVVGTYKNAKPLSEDNISIGKPSRYVLEINAGLADKYRIDETTRAVLINIFP